MRVTTNRSANLAYMDYLWRQYVSSDPDLRRLENEKRAKAREHRVKAYARQKRAERLRMWRDKIANAVAAVIIDTLFVVGLLYLLIIA